MKDGRWMRAGWVLAALLLAALPCSGQQIVREALASFSAATNAVEYSRPAQLRTLPDYQTLRARYLGPNLRMLEASLAKLGIQESDIDELMLGWRPAPQAPGTQSEGIALGRFDASAVDRKAAAQGIAATPVDGKKAYCFGATQGGSCVLVFGSSMGMFGSAPSLAEMLKTRDGGGQGMGTAGEITGLINEVQQQQQLPIWGVAIGGAIPKWFKGWMPGQKNLQLDWEQTFKDVRSLTYRIDAATNVELNVRMQCASVQAAQSLRNVFDGLKLVQKIAWQNMNPGRANPFESLEVDSSEQLVSFKLIADYAALEGAASLGSP